MSTRRDPDQLLEAFFEEGPEVLPDRVLFAVQDDVHRHPQRAVFGPWRLNTMRTYLTAAVLLLAVAGGGILLATRQQPVLSQPSPTPAVTPIPMPVGQLVAGTPYEPIDFALPFAFTVPEADDVGPVIGDIWAGERTFRLRPTTGGAITFHADVNLFNDICHPTGVATGVTGDIAGWLADSEGLIVSEPEQVGSATAWDIELAPECIGTDDEHPAEAVISFAAGEHHRIYDVPLEGGHMLVVTWGRGYGGEGDDVLETLDPYADAVVASITE